jgi:GH24 family phage-related lysozyme (muramidase)
MRLPLRRESKTRSTTVARFNAGDVTGAAEVILMWNKSHEIILRRYGEYHQFKGEPAYARTDATGNPVA